jgi:hypothetical protein
MTLVILKVIARSLAKTKTEPSGVVLKRLLYQIQPCVNENLARNRYDSKQIPAEVFSSRWPAWRLTFKTCSTA